jgi:hypothetical protein
MTGDTYFDFRCGSVDIHARFYCKKFDTNLSEKMNVTGMYGDNGEI